MCDYCVEARNLARQGHMWTRRILDANECGIIAYQQKGIYKQNKDLLPHVDYLVILGQWLNFCAFCPKPPPTRTCLLLPYLHYETSLAALVGAIAHGTTLV